MRAPVAHHIEAVGSIKWLSQQPFGDHDFATLVTQRGQLPGATATTPLLVVSRSGCTVPGVQTLGPQELLDAWRG